MEEIQQSIIQIAHQNLNDSFSKNLQNPFPSIKISQTPTALKAKGDLLQSEFHLRNSLNSRNQRSQTALGHNQRKIINPHLMPLQLYQKQQQQQQQNIIKQDNFINEDQINAQFQKLPQSQLDLQMISSSRKQIPKKFFHHNYKNYSQVIKAKKELELFQNSLQQSQKQTQNFSKIDINNNNVFSQISNTQNYNIQDSSSHQNQGLSDIYSVKRKRSNTQNIIKQQIQKMFQMDLKKLKEEQIEEKEKYIEKNQLFANSWRQSLDLKLLQHNQQKIDELKYKDQLEGKIKQENEQEKQQTTMKKLQLLEHKNLIYQQLTEKYRKQRMNQEIQKKQEQIEMIKNQEEVIREVRQKKEQEKEKQFTQKEMISSQIIDIHKQQKEKFNKDLENQLKIQQEQQKQLEIMNQRQKLYQEQRDKRKNRKVTMDFFETQLAQRIQQENDL